MLTKRLVVAFLVLSCGGPPTDPEPSDSERQPPLSGEYALDAFTTESVGNCSFVSQLLIDRVDFRPDGTMASPLPGAVDCHTEYPLHVTCKGLGSTFEVVGVWYYAHDGVTRQALGYGAASGEGCDRGDFSFHLEWQK